MKRVLITGSNGLLGQKLVNLLNGRPAVEMIAISRGYNRNPGREGYEYYDVDITDFKELEKIVRDFKPTDIINSAAMTQVDQCETDKEACDLINHIAVKELLRMSKPLDTRMIHVSTDFIFDGESGPYDENAVANPLSWYGRSKLLAEQEVLKEGDHAIARTVLVFGYVPGLSRTNIVLWLKESLENGKTVNVVEDQFRTPTFAEDLADGIARILMKDKTGIFNISGFELMSIRELAEKVADYWKLDKSLINPILTSSLNQPAPRPPKTGFIILKAETELGYKPHKFEDALSQIDRQLKERV
jgi:dTDP-4-dehydrorhamnose reductase